MAELAELAERLPRPDPAVCRWVRVVQAAKMELRVEPREAMMQQDSWRGRETTKKDATDA
jgi:hypothetical protein